ncbi:MAG: hypothetical protein IPP02_03370 [Chitinophagaceae bacterium]|nr:hypothetical protein [Chitinophagaceae bacterium]MBK7678878.1 hypothetical protein [Chitinophagaceae bacterium]MBK8299776.1 hypothetical protein [Chitinophagaceae bacterium]MBK9463826.1 hypothetical protein [Chitinophagaceae bacterium]MBK9659059.1 hypothetical protein [Chitinophagaceae bacterium]
MKRYKSIDFYLQVISLLMIVATTVINKPGIANPVIYIFLFACLQIVSILLHFFTGLQTWKKSIWRKYHLIGTAIVLLLIVAALIRDSTGRSFDKDDKYGMPGLEILIWTTIPAILVSLFYTFITWKEWRNIKQRELTQFR